MDETSLKIEELRRKIDDVDEELFSALHKRVNLAIDVAEIKHNTKRTFNDRDRALGIIDKVRDWASKNDYDEKYVENIWRSIIEFCVREQMKRYPYDRD